MGKKIDSIIEMYSLGLPAPRCVFVLENDNIEDKLNEYLIKYKNCAHLYTIRSDKKDDSISHKRLLSATSKQVEELSKEWSSEGYQIILQEFIDERNEVKSGNIYLKKDMIIIEGANDKHINFTNGKSLGINLCLPRFDSFGFEINKRFDESVFTIQEINRLIRLARKVYYTNVIIEFSFFNTGSLYFWEIKKSGDNI